MSDDRRTKGQRGPQGKPPLSDRMSLRPAEVAATLGVSDRTVRAWMRNEDLPYLRLDGVVLIPRASLEEWLLQRVTSERRADDLAAKILDGFSKRS